ncbi:unnamed protein product [Rotaria sp. Silwood2]|nr:unnamed protein product [Rotaria sp. Silwood2]
MDANSQEWGIDAFIPYYRNSLCNLQTVNNDLLATILQKNHSCAFFKDRSISFLSTNDTAGEREYKSVDEFREKVPLTTYEDYRDYADRMVVDGEKNLLCIENILYFAASTGTTGKFKLIPVTPPMIRTVNETAHLASSVIRKSFSFSLSSVPEQHPFTLLGGKNTGLYQRSTDDIPIGPLSQYFSANPTIPRTRSLLSINNTLTLNIIEGIHDFDTSAYVQLVFALAIPNVSSYTVYFASGFIHTIKLIENYFQEMSLCISSANFDQSSLVQKNIVDSNFRATLNQTLSEVITQYGGEIYRLERAEHIRHECLKKNVPGLLHRLWPNMIYASTTIGSTFSMYKEVVQYYCGERLTLINLPVYGASESFFGCIASIHTDEYFLLPTSVFFEFIKEEDIQQAQPKTLLLSELEPGHRYEVVCTTDGGLVRYRMGDVINCTRFFSRVNDLVPLPEEPVDIPQIPLISLAYRVGNVLGIFGEKVTEQHMMNALQQTIRQWREQELPVDLHDFTSCSKLDVFPAKFVIFVELTEDQGCKIDAQQLRILQNTASAEVDQQLCKTNQGYSNGRSAARLDSLDCIFVRTGTFSTFVAKFLMTDRTSPVQIKPHRILKTEDHIRFFYDNQIDISSP